MVFAHRARRRSLRNALRLPGNLYNSPGSECTVQRGRGLPQTINSREEPRGRRRGRKLLILLALIVGFLFAAQAALSSWVNLLWFRSLGYGDVFWTTLRLEWLAFLVFAVVTFLIMAAAFSALKRAYQGYLPSDHKIRSEERRVRKECRSRWSPDH